MNIRETVNQIKNEFEFNADDFMARVDTTQKLLGQWLGITVVEVNKLEYLENFSYPNGRQPIGTAYPVYNPKVPLFCANFNGKLEVPDGVNKDTFVYQEIFDGSLTTDHIPKTSETYGKWVCRHYAMADIVLRHKKLKGDHASNRTAWFIGANRLQKLAGEPADACWLDSQCNQAATLTYWVDMKGKTNFLYEQFKKQPIPPKGKKWILPMYVHAHAHAMTLTLKISHRKDGKVQYSVTWYDPNVTYNHTKIRIDNLEDLRAFDWQRLIPKTVVEEYGAVDEDPSLGDRVQWKFMPFAQGEVEALLNRRNLSNEEREILWREAEGETFTVVEK